MGYRGKLQERGEARRLRAQGWTMADIAAWLGVSKSSVSLWTRDVPFVPSRRRTGARRRPNRLATAKHAEINRLLEEGRQRIGNLSEREFLMAGVALYAGEGGKTDGAVRFANTNAAMIALFCRWLRHFFLVDESRLRVRLYLHEGLDLDAAISYWSGITGIPPEQFGKAYRAVADLGIRNTKHEYGCATIAYHCSRTHRSVMGLVGALLSSDAAFRGGEIGITTDC